MKPAKNVLPKIQDIVNCTESASLGGMDVTLMNKELKAAQVRMCGNSVSPPPAEALVRANYSEALKERMAA